MINRRYKELQYMRRQSRGNRAMERESTRSRGRTADPALERRVQDFGFMTTEAEAVEVRKALDMSEHDKADKQLASALGKIKDIDSIWGQAQDKFSTINIVKGSEIEGSYRLPKDIIDKLHGGEGGALNSGDGTYTGNWQEGNAYNVDVRVRGTDEARGKELHEMFMGAESDVKTQFFEEYGKQVADTTADAKARIAEQQSALDADRALTADALAQKQEHYQDIKAKSYAAAQAMGSRGGNE